MSYGVDKTETDYLITEISRELRAKRDGSGRNLIARYRDYAIFPVIDTGDTVGYVVRHTSSKQVSQTTDAGKGKLLRRIWKRKMEKYIEENNEESEA
jgi:hypothetical protein